jgi:hypothetical protein
MLAGAALTVVGATMLAPDDALAACSPATGSNVTVTCSGSTFNQGPGGNTGYGDSTQNGLTVNVQSGASVTGTSTGIDVNNNNTINNLGTITTQGSGGVGDVYGINGNGPLTVNNSGSIGRADAVNNIFDAASINALGGLTLTNQAGGVLQGGLGIQGGEYLDLQCRYDHDEQRPRHCLLFRRQHPDTRPRIGDQRQCRRQRNGYVPTRRHWRRYVRRRHPRRAVHRLLDLQKSRCQHLDADWDADSYYTVDGLFRHADRQRLDRQFKPDDGR